MYKTQEDFEREIESQLAKLDKDVRRLSSEDEDQSGIRCDFDLPYSTLPRLQSTRWLGSNLAR